jgi:hypothetical protein
MFRVIHWAVMGDTFQGYPIPQVFSSGIGLAGAYTHQDVENCNMTNDLDAWMADLASRPVDRGLGSLEAQIASDISLRRQQDLAARALAPARMVALGVALAVGAFAGGAVAASSIRSQPSPGTFAAGSALAPSTLLESTR